LPFEHPRGAFYFWTPIDSLGILATEFSRRLLAEKRALVMPGDSYGRDGKRFIRISYALAESRLCEGLRRLEEFADQLQPTILSARAVQSTSSRRAA
jgi:aminotransferase